MLNQVHLDPFESQAVSLYNPFILVPKFGENAAAVYGLGS